MKKTYYLHSYGCQMNLADSGVLSSALNNAGYRSVDEPTEAEVIIINTCSVREKAENRALGRLRDLAGIVKGSDTKICAVGCMAQNRGEQLLKEIPGIDFVLGTQRIFDLPELLSKKNGKPVVDTRLTADAQWSEFPPQPDNPFCAYVTITRGCDNFCAYCIVPYLRGREVHRRPEDILRDINHLVASGVQDITLVGQNVNSYGSEKTGFPDLIELVIRETDAPRIRFITSHPKDISNRLIALFADQPRLMGHLHLPLQCGSDRILEMMFRSYNYGHYRAIIERLRQARPDIALSTDLIVGFPTETEDEFQLTLDAVNEIGFDAAFMFRYSVREGTWAAKNLKDDIPEEIKLTRLQKLIDTQKDISYRVNQEEVGRIRSVLVDGTSRKDKRVWKGKSEGHKTVLFHSGEELLGKIVPIRIVSADSWTLHGEIAK